MITTLTFNPCVDKTVEIDGFVYGGMNRIHDIKFDYSGKGFNVASGIVNLGLDATATGFLYQDNGRLFTDALARPGLSIDCVWCDGAARTNTKVFDRNKKVVTELNESGVPASEEKIAQLLQKIEDYAKLSDYIVLSGSLPPNVPLDIYATIIKNCRKYCKIVLDTEGEKLKLGIEQLPTVVKPNLFELQTITDKTLSTKRDIISAARNIIDKGVEIVAVSFGADGAVIVDERSAFYSPPIKNLEVRSTVGAGDSMVAGLVVSLCNGLPVKESFMCAIAAAAACCESFGTGAVDQDGMDAMLNRVEIQAIH